MIDSAFPRRVVVVGASAGAVEALGQLLPALPSSFPFPIVIVVHLPAKPPSLLAPLFATRCALPVCEAEDKLPLVAGVYFAPPDYHLLLEAPASLALSIDEPVHFSRPSIDVLFESAANVFRARTIGVVLSGANEDGAAGLRSIVRSGGLSMVQAPTTAVMGTMPQAAIDAVPAAYVADAQGLAARLCLLGEQQR